MEPNSEEQNISLPSASTSDVCSVCHQPILPQYYFCPNCGAKLNSAPLSTTVATQAWIYALSIVLPMILFIFITRWPGLRYIRSSDPKAKKTGYIALSLLILSTIVTLWLVVVWTQETIQSTVNSINTDMSL